MATQKDPRFPCLVPGTVALQLRSPMAPGVERRGAGPVVIRNASASGLSVVFLDLRLQGQPDVELKMFEPVPGVVGVFDFKLEDRELRLPGSLVWYRRTPATRELAVAGFRLVPELLDADERLHWTEWVGLHTRGQKPASGKSAPRSTRDMLAEVDIRIPTIDRVLRSAPDLDAAEPPDSPRGQAAARDYLESVRQRARS